MGNLTYANHVSVCNKVLIKHIMFYFYTHYARTFKVLGHWLRIKDTSMVFIIGRD